MWIEYWENNFVKDEKSGKTVYNNENHKRNFDHKLISMTPNLVSKGRSSIVVSGKEDIHIQMFVHPQLPLFYNKKYSLIFKSPYNPIVIGRLDSFNEPIEVIDAITIQNINRMIKDSNNPKMKVSSITDISHTKDFDNFLNRDVSDRTEEEIDSILNFTEEDIIEITPTREFYTDVEPIRVSNITNKLVEIEKKTAEELSLYSKKLEAYKKRKDELSMYEIDEIKELRQHLVNKEVVEALEFTKNRDDFIDCIRNKQIKDIYFFDKDDEITDEVIDTKALLFMDNIIIEEEISNYDKKRIFRCEDIDNVLDMVFMELSENKPKII